MSIHVFLATAFALVSSVHTGSSSEANNSELCATPNNERRSDCNRIILKYFFNKTSGMCQHFKWSGCHEEGVFDSRYECVSTCNKDQGAPFCANSPPSPCEENKAGKETQKARERYYYNITTKKCQLYKFCGNKQELLNNNHFAAKGYCEKQCG
uniref:BPTI/Kunitz inhibitor domain-containing protein n=1 Tax=Amblyomma triste TaxID=251400 RepID=A0A023GCD1_AMBTT